MAEFYKAMKENTFRGEIWLPLSFDGLNSAERYEISNYGRVRHFNASIQEFKIGKLGIGDYAYYTSFKTENRSRKYMSKPIHRLVALNFLPKPTDTTKRFVIHKDFDKLNNHADNLQWVNQRELTEHNNRNPKVIAAKLKQKKEPRNSKLTEADVRRLKLKLERGKNRLSKLAQEFGITHTQLNRIRSGENWSHVKV